MSLPIVAIVGRPNVGKSTLFNRITRRRKAVVDKSSGVTRDRLYGEVEWSSRQFLLVDTGGLVPSSKQAMELLVKEQVEIALKEASLVLFLVNLRDGTTPLDLEIGKLLRRWGDKIVLVVNKVDSRSLEEQGLQFYSLGFGEYSPVSALHGRGIGDLLDKVVARLPESRPDAGTSGMRVTILGRPNVGKSSLVNRILGQERLVVDELPGTTRDSVDTVLNYGRETIILVDTAGLRRKSRIDDSVEYYTTLRALRSLEECQVAFVLMDSAEGIARQDKRIIRLAQERGRGIVLVWSKVDLIDRERKALLPSLVKRELPFVDWAPSVLTSSVTGEGIFASLDIGLDVWREMRREIGKAKLTEVVRTAAKRHPPPSAGKRRVEIHSCVQAGTSPPRFSVKCNQPRALDSAYLRYMEKALRRSFGFQGVPIKLRVER